MKTSNIILFLIISVLVQLNAQDKISPRLMDEMNQALDDNSTVAALVMLADQVDILSLDQDLYAREASLEERAYTVITTLQAKADETQPEILEYLTSKSVMEVVKVKRFWIANMLMVKAIPAILLELSQRNDVSYLDLDAELQWEEPIEEGPAQESLNSHEIGLERINAHLMWKAGFTGAGRIVMNDDTGVDGNHPALNYKWRGTQPGVPASAAWFDPETNTTFPVDGYYHGTHTMGTMCGLDPATNDTIGVAPGAQWIASKTINTSPHTSNSIAAWQWAIDPDNNPSTIDDMPDAIGNSWYDPNIPSYGQCDPAINSYINASNAVEAAGIAIVFSAGNSGPSPSSITSPKNYNLNEVSFWATGAVDGNNPSLPIASFSSRGPVISQCVTGVPSLDIKPEACAPGVQVRSSIPGTYGTASGTSMACPHVVGAIALLREAHPTITGYEAKMALYQTASDLGTSGEDNTYGMGMIDVWEAHNFLNELTVDQELNTSVTIDSIGHWEGGPEFVNYEAPVKFNFQKGSNEVLRGSQKIISNQKYHKWSKDDTVTNHRVFRITVDFPNRLVSKFEPTKAGIDIKNEFLSAPGSDPDGDGVDFKDPWFIDYPDPDYNDNLRNRGMKSSGPDALRFWSRSSPFNPDYNSLFGPEEYKYRGVFLDQSGPPSWIPPYYSVRAQQDHVIPFHGQDITWYFQGWSGTGVQFEHPDQLETAVVFEDANAVANANYKGHLASDTELATSYNNSRQVCYNAGVYHMVYEDGNHI